MPGVKQPAASQQVLLEIQMLPIILTFVSIEGHQFKYFTCTSSLRKAFFF